MRVEVREQKTDPTEGEAALLALVAGDQWWEDPSKEPVLEPVLMLKLVKV